MTQEEALQLLRFWRYYCPACSVEMKFLADPRNPKYICPDCWRVFDLIEFREISLEIMRLYINDSTVKWTFILYNELA